MKKGFTLIELLIVMAVIAGLVGILIPRFRGMQDEADIAKAKGELSTLQTAVESYFINNEAYPAKSATTDDCQQESECGFPFATLIAERPQIVDDTLNDPFMAYPYRYDLSNDGRSYIIFSRGPSRNGYGYFSDNTITLVNDASLIYVSNIARDTAP